MPIKDDGQIMQVDLNDYYKPEWLGGRFYGGAGHWSHQYNSQQFNFGFLGPSAFDRLYGEGAHQGYQNLLNQKRQRDELYQTILAELFEGGGFHYTFVKAFGRITIISSEGDPGEITWHMGTILFSNPSAWVFLENLVLISSSGQGGRGSWVPILIENTSKGRDVGTVVAGGLGLATDGSINAGKPRYQPRGYNPAVEARVARGMKVANGVVGVVGRTLGVFSAIEHGTQAYQAFDSEIFGRE